MLSLDDMITFGGGSSLITLLWFYIIIFKSLSAYSDDGEDGPCGWLMNGVVLVRRLSFGTSSIFISGKLLQIAWGCFLLYMRIIKSQITFPTFGNFLRSCLFCVSNRREHHHCARGLLLRVLSQLQQSLAEFNNRGNYNITISPGNALKCMRSYTLGY